MSEDREAKVAAAPAGASRSHGVAGVPDDRPAPPRRRLVVKPILTYPKPVPHPQTSWRNWGGIQSAADLEAETRRIRGELDALKGKADFPLEFMPLSAVRGAAELDAIAEARQADALLVYAAGDGAGDLMAEVNLLEKWGKDTVFFVRHQSGPLYYWYEGVSARFHRQHTDDQATRTIRCDDTVVDRMDDVLWRLRALAGLRATVGSRVLAIGWPDARVWPSEESVEPVRRHWKFAVQPVSYDELGKRLEAARARQRAEAYLQLPGTKLETELPAVENAFLLEGVFRGLLDQTGCRAITVAACMSAILPVAQTTACLALSVLNDAGYLAWCEADFPALPAATLLANISGRPVFFCAPGYPHHGTIMLAHCSAPRKMDGQHVLPARIMTHFESDYGAAPRVEFPAGQSVSMVVPDYASQRWLGLSGEIVSNLSVAACRTQVEVRYGASSLALAKRMHGYRWALALGDYLREVGYALRRVGIAWDCLTPVAENHPEKA
ncbi:MAG: hypothetical protein NUV77_23415 [Thermoguttaceae bacterium]|nr:hypothetical protein [Thermoguttaceae bacterium]